MSETDFDCIQERTARLVKEGGGGVGIFGFADLANFWYGFSVFALKSCGFSVLVFRAVCGFFGF